MQVNEEQNPSSIGAETAGQPPTTVSYGHYIAVAESLEATDKELGKQKRLAEKRLAVLAEVREAFVAARFAPALDGGCIRPSVAEWVRTLLTWNKNVEKTRDNMRHELENIYMLARMKRVARYRYPEGFLKVPAEQVGPASDDPDWDHVIRFCEQAGLKPTVLRTMGDEPDTATT